MESDTAALTPLVERLRKAGGEAVHVLRDPTRGGLASALNEIAASSGVGMVVDEERVPIPDPVNATCQVLGLDPHYVANEGILVAVVEPDAAPACLQAIRSHPLGEGAALIGSVTARDPGLVVLRTGVGGSRVMDLLPGDQLPRIC